MQCFRDVWEGGKRSKSTEVLYVRVSRSNIVKMVRTCTFKIVRKVVTLDLRFEAGLTLGESGRSSWIDYIASYAKRAKEQVHSELTLQF